MNNATETGNEPRTFPPGSFVHPTQLPGHIAHVLMVIPPEMPERPPIIGYTYVVILCPQFCLDDDFFLMSRSEQKVIIQNLEAARSVLTSTLATVEEAGLKLVSDEWHSMYATPASDPTQDTETDIGDDANDVVP